MVFSRRTEYCSERVPMCVWNWPLGLAWFVHKLHMHNIFRLCRVCSSCAWCTCVYGQKQHSICNDNVNHASKFECRVSVCMAGMALAPLAAQFEKWNP